MLILLSWFFDAFWALSVKNFAFQRHKKTMAKALKRPARVAKKGSKCPCGKWVPWKHWGSRTFCVEHSIIRGHRVDDRLFNRSGGTVEMKQIPRGICEKYPQLFAQWSHKAAGCGIVCYLNLSRLIMLPCLAFRKTLGPMSHEDLAALLKWFFVAHRQGIYRVFVTNHEGKTKMRNDPFEDLASQVLGRLCAITLALPCTISLRYNLCVLVMLLSNKRVRFYVHSWVFVFIQWVMHSPIFSQLFFVFASPIYL